MRNLDLRPSFPRVRQLLDRRETGCKIYDRRHNLSIGQNFLGLGENSDLDKLRKYYEDG